MATPVQEIPARDLAAHSSSLSFFASTIALSPARSQPQIIARRMAALLNFQAVPSRVAEYEFEKTLLGLRVYRVKQVRGLKYKRGASMRKA